MSITIASIDLEFSGELTPEEVDQKVYDYLQELIDKRQLEYEVIRETVSREDATLH